MKSSFDPESPMMRILDHGAELMALNVCFLLCCVPVVTAGAALTALYAALFLREDGGSAIRRFFREFRRDLRQGTALGLLLGAIGLVLAVDGWVLSRIEGYGLMKGLLFLTALGYLGVSTYAFALTARFQDKLSRILKNAFLLSISTLPRTVLMVLIDLSPLLLLMTVPEFFGRSFILWPLIGFALCAQLKVWILKDIFSALIDHTSTGNSK